MKSSRRPCPLCGEVASEVWMRKGSLVVVRCSHCRMAYLDPLPEEASDAYYDRLGRPYYLSPDKLEGDYASVRFERECAVLRRFCPRGAVLDVGCSTGGFLFQMKSRFGGDYQVEGIEVSAAAMEYARRHGLTVHGDSLLTHEFGTQRFDAITFWAVLEHLADPVAFVRRAADLLRPGGHLLALVPNARSLVLRLIGARYRYVLAQHVNYFTIATLSRLCAGAGLHVVAHGGAHFNPVVFWQDAWRKPDEFVADAERAALLRATTRLKQSLLLRPAKAILGGIEKLLAAGDLADNIWVVAHKPS